MQRGSRYGFDGPDTLQMARSEFWDKPDALVDKFHLSEISHIESQANNPDAASDLDNVFLEPKEGAFNQRRGSHDMTDEDLLEVSERISGIDQEILGTDLGWEGMSLAYIDFGNTLKRFCLFGYFLERPVYAELMKEMRLAFSSSA